MTVSPPSLLHLADFDGDYQRYIEAVFAVFYRDFIETQPRFKNCWVRCRRDPMDQGKEAGFWHCVSEGKRESDRTVDIERCKRIRWVRFIIDHAEEDELIDHWITKRRNEERHLLWYNEEYLVVLGKRARKRDHRVYYQLITAYCVTEEWRKRQLQKERDRSRNG